jgi:hypothetical protein
MGATSHFSLITTPIVTMGVLCHSLSIWPHLALHLAAERWVDTGTTPLQSRVSVGLGTFTTSRARVCREHLIVSEGIVESNPRTVFQLYRWPSGTCMFMVRMRKSLIIPWRVARQAERIFKETSANNLSCSWLSPRGTSEEPGRKR